MSTFDLRVVPHFFNPFVIGSNQFEIVDLLTFTVVGLQMVCRGKDSVLSSIWLVLFGITVMNFKKFHLTDLF